MRKSLIVLGLLLLPSALFAQGTLLVSRTDGQAERRTASGKAFSPLAVNQAVQAGDEIRTGPDSQVILAVPGDGSYMVVSENSKLIVEDFWSGSFKSIVNVMLGQVRFYIQRLGGRPNPYAVRTPTALIAVRGTTFDVSVDDAQFAEVRCFDGRVTVVENLTDREVVLEPGYKTLVRPGEPPLMPVRNEAELKGKPNRVLLVKQKNAPDSNINGNPSMEVIARDNDRRNRPSDPQGTTSRTNENTQRAKPTLTFPQ
jgi:hypothetical protein